MRRLVVVGLLCAPLTAFAGEQHGSGHGGSNGGGGGGHGPLGGVVGGIGGASRGDGGRGGGSAPQPRPSDNGSTPIVYDDRPAVVVVGEPPPPKVSRYNGGPAKLDVYVGAQKVVDSDGSWTVELAMRDGLFRLGGTITRYYEREPDDSKTRLTMPSLIGGVRVDDGGPSRVYLELGVVGAQAEGLMTDTSIAGGVGGVRVEHRLTRHSVFTAEIHEMIFEDDIRAHSARVGLRSGPIQASFRILDFNVGEALYGPELGLRF